MACCASSALPPSTHSVNFKTWQKWENERNSLTFVYDSTKAKLICSIGTLAQFCLPITFDNSLHAPFIVYRISLTTAHSLDIIYMLHNNKNYATASLFLISLKYLSWFILCLIKVFTLWLNLMADGKSFQILRPR